MGRNKFNGWITTIRRLKTKTFVIIEANNESKQIIFPQDLEIKVGDYIDIFYKVEQTQFGLDNILLDIKYHSRTNEDVASYNDFSLIKQSKRHFYFRKYNNRQPLFIRNKIISKAREFFDNMGFIHLSTPIVSINTNEGANSFVISSETLDKKFSLPQSPQIYKMLAMYSGITKYYQIAPCFRDEPLRQDRLFGDFYQLDVEMAQIYELDELLIHAARTFRYITKKYLPNLRFVCINYFDCMEKYKTDKPNVENHLFCIHSFPFFKKELDGSLTPEHNPFTRCFNDRVDVEAIAEQFDFSLNGYEILSGGCRENCWENFYKRNNMNENQIKEAYIFKSLMNSGTPRIGGYAFGLDRIIQICCNLQNIEDSVFAPHNKSGNWEIMEEYNGKSNKEK